MTYTFTTNTVLPIEGFTTFGINAKPNSSNPIGYFGTGLKYAVAIILRLGGKMRVLIDGKEYEFYTSNEDFRGKMFKKIRMRKRGDILSRWRYEPLPFTTELGKNWELWQAFRELESNTRDENGQSGERQPCSISDSVGRTVIEVDCNGFNDVANDTNRVFLDDKGEKVHENENFVMYDSPSKYLYYRGVRVYDMRYPARYTYDFKQGRVDLSEDRSARNSFMMFWYISGAIMREIDETKVLYKALNTSENKTHFEGHDLSFSSTDYGISDAFKEVARKLSMKGFTSTAVSSAYYSFIRTSPTVETMKVSLTENEWRTVRDAIECAIVVSDETDLFEKVLAKIEEQTE